MAHFIRRLINKGEAVIIEGGAPYLLGMPRMELTDGSLLVIENHRGVAELTGSEIAVRVREGQVVVRGVGLRIRGLNHEELVVGGEIHAVELVRRKID
jgi:sporulation protein YqfC